MLNSVIEICIAKQFNGLSYIDFYILTNRIVVPILDYSANILSQYQLYKHRITKWLDTKKFATLIQLFELIISTQFLNNLVFNLLIF